MHRELVEERAWLTEQNFLRALSLCMLLPGPEAMQLATYAGWRLRGTIGGLIAGLLFVLPGAAVILALALVYAVYGQVPLVQAAFDGIKAAVIIIVLQALLKVSQKALTSRVAWAIAAFAFTALFLFDVPYPIVIAVAAVLGAVRRIRPEHDTPPPAVVTKRNAAGKVLIVWGGLWAVPIILLWMLDYEFLMEIALFFSKLAVVSFGGAYAVLAYMTQTVVADYGWITTPQMIDALGLAETTPGPLILVTQFVAMLAGFAQEGWGMAIAAGAVALWVTFTPCFLWIFLAAPYLDHLSSRPRITSALAGITAAVVGVIFNLSVWFAVHVLFAQMIAVPGIAAPLPEITSLNPSAVILTTFAGVLLIGMKRGIAETLGVMAVAGICLAVL